jgi:TPR repeat protein
MSGNWLIGLRFLAALVLSTVPLATPVWADFKSGEKAYQRYDYATALREWQPLAKQGHAAAQYQLGLLYNNGQGVPRDDAQARQWYEKAANQGHALAQVNLGILFDYGRGTPQDFKMAVRWYTRAANQGNELAQQKLGLLYERGDGVPKDFVQAYKWYKLGATSGTTTAVMRRDELAVRMTSDQLVEAKKLAREWKPQPK